MPLGGVPVQVGEIVEVREWSGRGDDWQSAVAGVPAEDLRFEVDPQDPAVQDCRRGCAGMRSRICTARPARSSLRRRARARRVPLPGAPRVRPPAGSPIVVSYVTGGGVDGNVAAGAIRELRSGVGFVESVAQSAGSIGRRRRRVAARGCAIAARRRCAIVIAR